MSSPSPPREGWLAWDCCLNASEGSSTMISGLLMEEARTIGHSVQNPWSMGLKLSTLDRGWWVAWWAIYWHSGSWLAPLTQEEKNNEYPLPGLGQKCLSMWDFFFSSHLGLCAWRWRDTLKARSKYRHEIHLIDLHLLHTIWQDVLSNLLYEAKFPEWNFPLVASCKSGS